MTPAAKVPLATDGSEITREINRTKWGIVNYCKAGAVHSGLQTMACHAIVSDDRYRATHYMQTVRQTRRRSISASICLLMVALLYAPFAGAAWASYLTACCKSGQCPIAAHHHQKAPAAPANPMDCGHDMPGMMTCAMSCCHDSDRSLIASMAFVLPPPAAATAMATIDSPIELTKPPDFRCSIEPLSPPPRFVSAAA